MIKAFTLLSHPYNTERIKVVQNLWNSTRNTVFGFYFIFSRINNVK